jgi:hypothetical protein
MDVFNRIIDAALVVYFACFSWAPAALPLTLLSAVAGGGMLWVFSRTSDQPALKAVKRRAHAALLELRVFADEPRVTWRAQKALAAANLRYLALSLKPAAWMILPMAVLLIHLESFYGRAPLPPEREAVVTMGMASSWDPRSAAPEIAAPAEVEVEGPPVRVVDAREVSWRLRPKSECSGLLRFRVAGREVDYPIEAGARRRRVPGRSVRPAWAAVWHPAPRVSGAAVEWIEIRYPEAALTVFGFHVNWLVWFFAISMATALLLKGRFRVVI